MIELMTAIAVWCRASNEYISTVDECKRRIARCVALQKTEMDKQYCFYEPVEKPWPVSADEKERQR
jgi:hypothetical protein